MSKIYKHIPVMLSESIDGLNICPEGIYIDGTFGCGGHSRLILSMLGKKGRLLAIDRDLEAINIGKSIQDSRFNIIHSKFSNLENYIKNLNLLGKINGIILDLGLSSQQLNDPNRGFSFMHDGPLDMRMDTTLGKSAAEWIKKASINDIAWVLKTFGEERFSKRIAKSIKNHKKEIIRTHELSEIIKCTIPYVRNGKHPATRSFQAIRIYINNELDEIQKLMESILNVLSPGGRLSVISFHSLEDRLIKNFIKKYNFKNYLMLKNLYSIENNISNINDKNFKLKIIGKIKPSKKEIINNPRARSALLRVSEKLHE